MVLLRLLCWRIWVLPLVLRLRLLIVVNLDEERNGNTLELCTLALLINPVLFQVQDIPNKDQFLL